jgi:hypothetical protein
VDVDAKGRANALHLQVEQENTSRWPSSSAGRASGQKLDGLNSNLAEVTSDTSMHSYMVASSTLTRNASERQERAWYEKSHSLIDSRNAIMNITKSVHSLKMFTAKGGTRKPHRCYLVGLGSYIFKDFQISITKTAHPMNSCDCPFQSLWAFVLFP